MIDKDTGLIEHDISMVLEYLFSNNGKIPLVEVKQRESEL